MINVQTEVIVMNMIEDPFVCKGCGKRRDCDEFPICNSCGYDDKVNDERNNI